MTSESHDVEDNDVKQKHINRRKQICIKDFCEIQITGRETQFNAKTLKSVIELQRLITFYYLSQQEPLCQDDASRKSP